MEKCVMTDGKRRKGVVVAAAVLSGVLALTACGGDGGGGDSDSDAGKKQEKGQAQVDRAAAEEASDARIVITPKDGSDNTSINAVGVSVEGGKLTSVTMKAAATGQEVAGTLAADGTSWKPDGQLERSTRYTISAKAEDPEGRTVHGNSTFTTVSPENSFIGYFTPEDGSTVGVGMPVSINFDKGITNRKLVQSSIEVNSTSGQEIVGHWFSDTRLDFRPKDYWKAGSKVTVDLNLDGVEGAEGITGVQDKSFSFTVGRSQVSTVDVKSKTMEVVRDGKTIRTVKISAGAPETPTYNGQMVISEKFEETRMDGATVGFTDDDGKGEYDIPDVPHAMRLSTSGTFIHGNYWGADSIFGSANTSHGCVGLNDVKGGDDPNQDAAWFFDNSLLGDLVIVKNSPDKQIAPHNGLNGWNMSWEDWKAGSAL
ncbi:L,D-transpeptidase family protein [Streptomyces sp. TRM43335]|uniref:L,D-transpeptidase family protein n=1 Tax=Streptomyces taklimakanensis TaxID=2569853 RepID=A0A6G2BF98_9ACTN|nr:Ig-like domain-containing protein [Streptomyces taklimakanensis]MTE20749.1 L,D-transpeptidase family protein [Streptomyces taklimakanensis]